MRDNKERTVVFRSCRRRIFWCRNHGSTQRLAPGKGITPVTPGREKIGGTADLGYLHCGQSRRWPFREDGYNGIEYGLMAAYAEDFGVLRRASIGEEKTAINAETAPLRNPNFISTN